MTSNVHWKYRSSLKRAYIRYCSHVQMQWQGNWAPTFGHNWYRNVKRHLVRQTSQMFYSKQFASLNSHEQASEYFHTLPAQTRNISLVMHSVATFVSVATPNVDWQAAAFHFTFAMTGIHCSICGMTWRGAIRLKSSRRKEVHHNHSHPFSAATVPFPSNISLQLRLACRNKEHRQ